METIEQLYKRALYKLPIISDRERFYIPIFLQQGLETIVITLEFKRQFGKWEFYNYT